MGVRICECVGPCVLGLIFVLTWAQQVLCVPRAPFRPCCFDVINRVQL
jgi:hypothetical protein